MASGYALRYCDPVVVGALELPWPIGVQAVDGGLTAFGDAVVRLVCHNREVVQECLVRGLVLAPEGPIVCVADMDVAEAPKELDGAGSHSDSGAVFPASSEFGESPTFAKNEYAAPCTAAAPETVCAKFTPRSQPPTGVEGKRARRARAPIEAPGVGTTGGADPGAKSSEHSLLSRVFLTCSTASCGVRGGGFGVCEGLMTLPPRDGILMGL